MEPKVIINREKSKEFSIGALISGIARLNQKFIQNYFKNYSGYQHDNHDIERTYSSFWEKLFSEPEEMKKVQNFYLKFLEKQQALWKNVFVDHYLNKGTVEPFISPKKGDNRFRAPQWSKSDYFDFLKQSHLLTEQLALRIVDDVEIGEPIRHRLDFYTKQYINLLSPANFLFTNPEALELAAETKGKSLWNGFNNFVRDVEGGGITQVDKSAFEVGKNLATTPGAVIFENELMQLIQYTPSTKSVFELPLVIIPPCINKYYILDLHPENSFVKYMVDQGFTVFIVSWKNPSPEIADLTFDDYVNKGPLTAIDIVKEVSEPQK